MNQNTLLNLDCPLKMSINTKTNSRKSKEWTTSEGISYPCQLCNNGTIRVIIRGDKSIISCPHCHGSGQI
jgi:hypothetical protein